MKGRIESLFVGGLSSLPPRGAPTGIFKHPVTRPVHLAGEGLTGDVQADRRVHGGPEKALHQYALTSYAVLRSEFPAAASAFLPGSLGENLVADEQWDEDSVCIGDVFRLGGARIQVSQPRSPCWKINDKFGLDGLSRFIAAHGIVGWYYRVLDPGDVAPGDPLELVERGTPEVSLRELWLTFQQHRPAPEQLARLRSAPGLAPNWIVKLDERMDWLRRHPQK